MTTKPSLAGMPMADVLRLCRTPQVGVVTFFGLIARFGSAGKALENLSEVARRGGRKEPLVAASAAIVAEEMEAVAKFGARLVAYGAADYPELLHTIPDPPPVLTVRGHPSLWQKTPRIAMVGARNASGHGCNFAKTLSEGLGKAGAVIVSGLARGIDSFAHKATLETGTVAVIAGGIDTIYPPENKALFESIAAQGAIISEQPFGRAPIATSFPSRNRIIAGMSEACVIVEAALKSGSLITARLAGEYDREVFAVPGSPMDPRAQGCNRLLKDGAHLVESAEDILAVLRNFSHRALLREHLEGARMGGDAVDVSAAESEKVQQRVLESLGVAPISIDMLIDHTGIPAPVLLAVLLELELAERIKRLPGGMLTLGAL